MSAELSKFARKVLFRNATCRGYRVTYVGCSMVKFINNAGDEIIINNEGLPFRNDFLPEAWEKFLVILKKE